MVNLSDTLLDRKEISDQNGLELRKLYSSELRWVKASPVTPINLSSTSSEEWLLKVVLILSWCTSMLVMKWDTSIPSVSDFLFSLCAGISWYKKGSENRSGRKQVCIFIPPCKKEKKVPHSPKKESTWGPYWMYGFIKTWKKLFCKNIRALIWTDRISHLFCYLAKMSFPLVLPCIYQHMDITLQLKEI